MPTSGSSPNWALLWAAAVSLAAAAPRLSAEQPVVKGLWVLPTQFHDSTDPDDPVVDGASFASAGEKFLGILKKRTGGEFKVLKGPDATREKVLTALTSTLASLKQKGSIFLFYFGGHGVRIGAPPSASPHWRRGPTYFALQNGEIGDAAPTFSKMVMLEELMGLQSAYEHTYFMGYVDACFSGNISFDHTPSLRSETLGPRGFLLCSSSGDRKSYADDFTKALGVVYEKDDVFNKIRTPGDLLVQVRQNGTFVAEQMPVLVPRNSELQITYPLPGLCFFCLDFGGLVSTEIHITITPGSGRPYSLSFNQPDLGGRPQRTSLIALPLQALDGTKIRVNFSELLEKPEFTVNLARAGPFLRHSIRVPGVQPVIADSSADYQSAVGDWRSLMARAKGFNLSDSEITTLGVPMLSNLYVRSNLKNPHLLAAEEVKLLVKLAPRSAIAKELRLIAAVDSPTLAIDEFATVENALKLKLPVSGEMTHAYSRYIQSNVALNQMGSEMAWIEPKELTSKYHVAIGAISRSPNEQAALSLLQSLGSAASPGDRVLSKEDVASVTAQVEQKWGFRFTPEKMSYLRNTGRAQEVTAPLVHFHESSDASQDLARKIVGRWVEKQLAIPDKEGARHLTELIQLIEPSFNLDSGDLNEIRGKASSAIDHASGDELQQLIKATRAAEESRMARQQHDPSSIRKEWLLPELKQRGTG